MDLRLEPQGCDGGGGLGRARESGQGRCSVGWIGPDSWLEHQESRELGAGGEW